MGITLSHLRAPRLLVLFLALALLAGCGGGGEEEAVRSTVESFTDAGASGDEEAYCSLLSTELRDRYEKEGSRFAEPGQSGCEATVSMQPQLKVDDSGAEVRVEAVSVEGDRATAKVAVELPAVSAEPIVTTFGLLAEDGEWRISSFPGSSG